MEQDKLSHLDKDGSANMVDISEKNITTRAAYASCIVFLSEKAYQLVKKNKIEKGNVLNIAKIAAISASKKTHDLIPLCHPLALTKVQVEFFELSDTQLEVRATCKVTGQTGVEMEALSAVSVAALTVYDMCKAIDKGMLIGNIRLLEKTGGKSGDWSRDQQNTDVAGALVT